MAKYGKRGLKSLKSQTKNLDIKIKNMKDMVKTKEGDSGLIHREKEKALIQEGLKKKNTHPSKTTDSKPGHDPNGMTAKTLPEMKKNLKKVPHTSAATKHDKAAYERKKK